MGYSITIQDSVDIMTIAIPERPLTESIIEGLTEITTLDMNIYTDFFAQKRVWEDTIRYMSKYNFDRLKGFYDRQFTSFSYPTISIPGLDVSNVVVRMKLTPRKIVDNHGGVSDVTINFRETIQMSVVS